MIQQNFDHLIALFTFFHLATWQQQPYSASKNDSIWKKDANSRPLIWHKNQEKMSYGPQVYLWIFALKVRFILNLYAVWDEIL